jgi:3-oxoadipate CoA-transferase alpha subunit
VIEKILPTFDEAVADVPDGATIMFSGFGNPGVPTNLILALLRQGAKGLVGISNRAGGGRGISDDDVNVGTLVKARRMRKMVCTISAPAKSSMEVAFDRMYQAGEIEAELVPQGTLAERIRAAGAGLGGFYTPTGVGTELAEGKEVRRIDGRDHLLEYPLAADYAFLRAWRADNWGNLQFRLAQRNFGPLMAMAARITVVEVEEEIVPVGTLDPDHVHLPGNYVQRMVRIPPLPIGHWIEIVRQPREVA